MGYTFRSAAIEVLSQAEGPLKINEIWERIAARNLLETSGATPSATFGSQIMTSIKKESASPFVRVGKGLYTLRDHHSLTKSPAVLSELEESETDPSQAKDGEIDDSDDEQMGLIQAFGMYWDRGEVNWKGAATKLLGRQEENSITADFGKQNGVYLLHGAGRVMYVGRAIKESMGARIARHTKDRHAGRWDRFSWFGVRGVDDDGSLLPQFYSGFSIGSLIETMEALLIEGLEPPQNRRGGDSFGREYLQAIDPIIEQKRNHAVLSQLMVKAGVGGG